MLFHEPVSVSQPCCSIDLVTSSALLSLDCRKREPYLGIWRQNEFRFFAGRTYTRYRNAFQEQSRGFRCTLDCREQQSNRLADVTNKNIRSDHFGQK